MRFHLFEHIFPQHQAQVTQAYNQVTDTWYSTGAVCKAAQAKTILGRPKLKSSEDQSHNINKPKAL